MTAPGNRGLAAFALTILLAGITVTLLSLLGPDWSRFSPATCTETRCFCEMPRSGAILLQPANSFSSFGYVFVGCLMILMARSREWTSAFPRPAAFVLGCGAIIVGIGSALLHATLTLWGQFYDVAGMYLISAFFLVSAVAKWRGLADRHAAIGYALLSALLIAVLIALPEVRRSLFGAILIIAIILEVIFARPLRPQVRTRYYVAGLIANAVAFVIWTLDQGGQLCAPDSLLQGHAIWHLLGALALWFVFLYYRSERSADQQH